MPKIYSKNQQIGNKGVAQVARYCSHHQPAIIFRQTPNDDIGLDGEIELVNSEGHALGVIIKVQIKSTETEKSYIRNETETDFTFYASVEDIKYWKSIENDVLLVIYDNRNNNNVLYARSVKNIDPTVAGRNSIPVIFNKEFDILLEHQNDFFERFSPKRKHRCVTKQPYVPQQETLISNLIKLQLSPQIFIAPITVRPYSPQSFNNKTPRKKQFSEKEYADVNLSTSQVSMMKTSWKMVVFLTSDVF